MANALFQFRFSADHIMNMGVPRIGKVAKTAAFCGKTGEASQKYSDIRNATCSTSIETTGRIDYESIIVG
jgi:hypothetical protein